jgi:signal transduction histidine kinase
LDLRAEVGQLEVTTDRELLALILQNLVANAVKYSAKGAVRVVSSGECAEGRVCRLSVLDEGPGIEPEKLNQLFGAFQRGETHGQPGSGLGLNIARQAADLLGAKLWADSTPGQGSAFHVELPKEPPRGQKPE